MKTLALTCLAACILSEIATAQATRAEYNASFKQSVRLEWVAFQEQQPILRTAKGADDWNTYLAKLQARIESTDVASLTPQQAAKMVVHASVLPDILKGLAHFQKRASVLAEENKMLKEQLAQRRAAPREPVPPPLVGINRNGAEKHWIKQVMGNGSLIELEDGSIWQVSPLDQIDTALWLAITDVLLVNGEKIINLDDNETAEVKRLR